MAVRSNLSGHVFNRLKVLNYVKDATNIREGVVITPLTERHVRGLGRLQLKLVSNAYLEKDSK